MNALDCMGVCLALGPDAPTLAPLLEFSGRDMFDNVDGYACWSNGYALVAVRGETVAEPSGMASKLRRAQALEWALDIESVAPHFASERVVGRATGFCGRCGGEGRRECANCHGDGTHYCYDCNDDHDCGKCGGDGATWCPECQPGSNPEFAHIQRAIRLDIGGVTQFIDAGRLQHLVGVLTDQRLPVAWVLQKGTVRRALYVESHSGARWGLLMPLSCGPEGAPTVVAVRL